MRYIRLLLIILLFLCLTLNETWAAEETITWIGCVKEAKRQHPALVSAAEKINEAKASKEITRSAVLPQITGAAERTTTQQPSGGGTSSGMTSASSAKRKPPTVYEYNISGQQLLFDGFKTSYDLSAAERNIRASQYDYDVTSSNVRVGLRTAYANLLIAQELLTVSEEIEGRRRQNLALVKLRYEGGREHKGSLATSEADLAQAVYDVDQARRAIYAAQRQLTKELGRRKFVPIKAAGDLEPKSADSQMPDFEKLAETNPLLRQLIEKKEAAMFGLKSAYASFFPQIYTSGSLGNINTTWPPDKNQWSAGASLTLPIFDGGNLIASASKAKATLGQNEADERSGRDSVIFTLSDTWIRLEDAIENVSVQRQYLEAAKERARISEAEYAIGLLIYDNWIIIENNLVAAKRSFLSAELNALTAEANWIQAKGGTLDYDEK